jgi:hypothetical protein
VAGFPFRLEVRCDGASVSLISQTAGQATSDAPITAKLGEILVVAQVYDPKLLIAEFAAPATLAERGGQPSMSANWSKAHRGGAARGAAAGLDRVRGSRYRSPQWIDAEVAGARQAYRTAWPAC